MIVPSTLDCRKKGRYDRYTPFVVSGRYQKRSGTQHGERLVGQVVDRFPARPSIIPGLCSAIVQQLTAS